MYIQFSDFYQILKHYDTNKSKFKERGDKDILFNCLFASYTKDYEVNYDSIRKMIRNERPVNQKIRDYYEKNGVEQLKTDILENVFPELISPRAFAAALSRTILYDSDLMELLKSNGAELIPKEGDKELALYVANVLYVVINRPHYPATKDGKIAFPEWISPQLNFRLISKRVPKASDYFVGRNKELRKLKELLDEGHEVFVWGIPGIGKSELVYQYCEEYSDEYNNILYINSTGKLREDICTLQIIGATPDTGDMFRDILFCLSRLREDTLLVIDNLNTLTRQEELCWKEVLECGCKLLVTTQYNMEEHGAHYHFELEEIKDMRSLISLVKFISKNKNLSTNVLKRIIKTVHRHTTAVVLLGMLLQRDRHTTGEILRALNLRKLKDFFGEKLFFANKKDSFRGHLRTLFYLFRFQGLEREVLKNMVLMPGSGVPLKYFEKWTALEDTDVVDGLVDQGMIQGESADDANGYQYLISLKPIIRELASEEFTPSIQNCATLIRNTAQTMHLLMDRREDCFLLQLAQEVIAWAKIDDIPVYIDYLHKSFELTARQNHKTGMQEIADALALILDETTYGMNVDKALMQDYQAAASQGNPRRAIAFRKSAFSLLDLDNTEERRLGAEILDRISGNFAEMNEWDQARKYSDLCWAMFRELGMLEKMDIFPFACRRGVILCYGDEVEGGLSMLHKIEEYVTKNETQPTQNRLIVQTALSEAYEAAGNMEKSKKYMQESQKSLVSLKNSMEEIDYI